MLAMRTPTLLTSLAFALTGFGLTAQFQKLTLSGEAGSFPGKMALELSPGKTGAFGAVLLSPTPGPIPVRLIQSGDPRVLHVGATALMSMTAIFFPGGKALAPVVPVPNNPSFLDATIYLQAITLNEIPGKIVTRISQPEPIRFAVAGRFRDRRTQFNAPRAFFPIVERGDQKMMMIGGGSGALLAQIATDKTEYYDPLTDSFKAGPNMRSARSLHTATKLLDGRYLVVGGVDAKNDPQASAEIYDPATDQFTAVKSMAVKRMAHTASLLPDGRVLVAGGMLLVSSQDILGSIGSIQNNTEIYDPKTNSWSGGPNMRAPRAAHSAITLPDGRILLVGGISWFKILIVIPQILKDCDIYDPKSNRIVAGPGMSTPHTKAAVVSVGSGRWLLAGGGSAVTLTGGGGITMTDVAEIYDAGKNSWSSAGKLSMARGAMEAFKIGSKVYCFGGGTGSLTKPIATNATDAYDIASGKWSVAPAMSASRLGFGAYVTKLGQIHFLGGGSGPAATVRNTTDWYYR